MKEKENLAGRFLTVDLSQFSPLENETGIIGTKIFCRVTDQYFERLINKLK